MLTLPDKPSCAIQVFLCQVSQYLFCLLNWFFLKKIMLTLIFHHTLDYVPEDFVFFNMTVDQQKDVNSIDYAQS